MTVLKRSELAAVAAVHAVLAVVVTWPLAWRPGAALPGDLGDPLLNTFILAWDADRIAHGLAGLWNAPFFFPFQHTLAYSEHLLGIACFTAPLQWLGGNAVLVYNMAFIGSYVLAGVGMYGLARELWGHEGGAWVASVAFACAPHRVMHVSHLQVLMSGWMPVALWALHRYFRTGSRRALAGFVAAFCIQGLANGYFLYFFGLMVLVVGSVELGGLVTARFRRERRSLQPGRAVGELAAAALVVGLVFAPVASAYYGVQRETGFRRTAAEAQSYSARPSDYLRVDADVAAWRRLLPEAPAERSVFPGATVVLLAGLGLVAAARRPEDGRRREALGYAAVAGLAFWLSLGPDGGLYGRLMSVVPGFDGLRVPARFVVILALALATLAAAGARWLLKRLPGGRSTVWAAAALAAVLAVEGYGGPMFMVPFDPAQRQRTALHAWLGTQPPGAMLELPIAGPDIAPYTLPYQYATLLHGRPIVNGYSGWGSGLQNFLAGPGTPVHGLDRIDDLLEALSSIGVRYIVLHRADYARQVPDTYLDPQEFADAMDGSAWTEEAGTFLPTNVWRLKPTAPHPPPSPAGQSPMAVGYDFQVTASHRADRLWAAVDGDSRSTWLNGQPQAGDEWIDLELSRQRDVARLDLGLPVKALANYPRRLRIESVATDGTVAVLFEGSALPLVLDGLIRHPRDPFIELDLPPNESMRVRIRQTGQSPKWNWEISELRAWRR